MLSSRKDTGIGCGRRPIDACTGRNAFALVACLGFLLAVCGQLALAKPPRAAAVPAATSPATGAPAATAGAERPDRLAAMVNGSEISQGELATECLGRHGAAVTEMLVNRRIIEQACGRQGVVVTPQDVDADIDAMARRFNLPRDKWIELIQQERGVTPKQYAEEIVWPMIALRRLAHAGIEPGETEISQAFENQFGPAVKARIIVVRSRQEAEQVRAAAIAAPDDFGAIARQRSVDVGSASANGWVKPIRRHAGDPGFEKVVFSLEPGAISEVVQVADQFIVIKCEGRLPASGTRLDDVRQRLAEELRERRSRAAAGEVFRRLQDEATVENILNDPAKSAASPGVAARVNGDPIGLDQVREACVERHGRETLDILITRRLIEQALARDRQTISQADVDAEIARAAEAMGFRRPDGSPDVSAWLDRVTRDEKLPMRHYIEDVVRPSVALKKLVGKVPVSKEDLDKAFAATFGPRARCRVIILDNQRRAQEVWQLARENPTAERIGELAERYSADPTSKSLRGEVPPIQRYGGQPAIEREAFALKPGELSGVVQVADRFMVLFCEGFTEPARVNPDEVRDELYADIFEKKQRIEMARYFTQLRESAAIDNFVAGTSQSPVQVAGQRTPPPPAAAGPSLPTAGSSLTRAEAEALAAPRAGSRRAGATAAGTPAAGGVVPASLDEPIPGANGPIRAAPGADAAR